MNLYNFLQNLGKLFEIDKEIDNFAERAELYAKNLKRIEEKKEQKIDYESTINNFIKNYQYKNYPNFSEIYKNLVFFPKEHKEEKVFKPKQFIYKKNGMIYEFEEVSLDWKGIHTMSDFEELTEKSPPPPREEVLAKLKEKLGIDKWNMF